MKFHIFTLGCKVNQYESQAMLERLENSGFEYSKSYTDADIVIVNSCTVTAASDSKAVKLMHRIRRENPHCILVLTGCMPQAFPDEFPLFPQFRNFLWKKHALLMFLHTTATKNLKIYHWRALRKEHVHSLKLRTAATVSVHTVLFPMQEAEYAQSLCPKFKVNCQS